MAVAAAARTNKIHHADENLGDSFDAGGMAGTSGAFSRTMLKAASSKLSSGLEPTKDGVFTARRRQTLISIDARGTNKEAIDEVDDTGGAGGGGSEGGPPEPDCRDLMFFLFDGFTLPLFCRKYPRWYIASDILQKLNFFLVIVACVAFATETLPEFYERDLLAFFIIEIICNTFFTIDIVARFTLAKDKIGFIKSFLNWVDFVSILPFYIQLMTQNSSVDGLIMIRMLRLLRILRVLKLSRHNVGLEAVVEAITESSEAISLLVFLLLIAMVLFSSAIFYAEQLNSHFDEDRQLWIRDEDRSVSPFQSIFHSMWWCMVTMTTVGYGDAYPTYWLGKLIASVTMLCGIFVLAFPTVILSTNFQEIHQSKVDAQKQLQKEAELDEQEEVEQEARAEEERQEKENEQQQNSSGQQQQGGQAPSTGNVDNNGSAVAGEGSSQNAEGDDAQLLGARHNQEDAPNAPAVVAPASNGGGTGAPASTVLIVPTAEPAMSTGAGSSATSGNSHKKSVAENRLAGQTHAPSPRSGTRKPYFFKYVLYPYGAGAVNSEQRENENEDAALRRAAKENDSLVIEKDVLILDSELAIYEPPLYLQASHGRNLNVRVERVGSRAMVTFHLVLESDETSAAVLTAIQKHRPSEEFTIFPRPIVKMKVFFSAGHPLLQGIQLMTSRFFEPAGVLPLTLLVPSIELVGVLLANISSITFHYHIFYEGVISVEESLVHYGGMMLCGTSVDDEEDVAQEKEALTSYYSPRPFNPLSADDRNAAPGAQSISITSSAAPSQEEGDGHHTAHSNAQQGNTNIEAAAVGGVQGEREKEVGEDRWPSMTEGPVPPQEENK